MARVSLNSLSLGFNSAMLTTVVTLGSVLVLSLMVMAIVSFYEKEKRAGIIFCLLSLGSIVLPLFLFFFLFDPVLVLFWSYALLYLGVGILFLPIDWSKRRMISGSGFQIDERDVMFSRNELIPDSSRYKDYYTKNPHLKETDDKFRVKPGLLSTKAQRYHGLGFAAAEASFDTVDLLKNAVDGSVTGVRHNVDPVALTNFILNWTKKLGALDVGICEMKKEHWYSYKGRGEEYGNEIVPEHQFGIAFTVEMNQEMVDAAPSASIVMESGQQYLEAGKIAIQVAKFIRNLGWEARAHIDGNYRVVCPLVARDAGLGEIGRMGLLMTPKQGPRVRIGVITSNIPIKISRRKKDESVIDFCEICKKCAEVCPSRAISHKDRAVINGSLRWQINSESCFSYWCTTGTDCGRCMRACPYAHPNNLLHNVVRWGIRRSWLFRHIALIMDDLFYGRKPMEKKMPQWIKKN